MTIYNHLWHQPESAFYYDVISRLNLKIPHDVALVTKFHSYNGNCVDPWPELKQTLIRKGKPVIIFLCGDEFYTVGDEYCIEGITTLIFKQYAYYHLKDHPIIRPIPLSLLNANFNFSNVPINERVFDYSFTGTCHLGREVLRQQLLNRQDKWVKFVHFFHSWVDVETYKHIWNKYLPILQNTKVSLCPSGPRSNESFRMIESARCGNIIVATELIPHWYNVTCPYIKIDSWDDISVIDSVLSKSEKELQDLSHETSKWYEECLSSRAVARYVNAEIDRYYENNQ